MKVYSRQHQMLEQLRQIKVNYIGKFEAKDSRKYTLKATNKQGGLYLYSWEYFKKEDGQVYSKEKGAWIKRKPDREGAYCHSVYIGTFDKVKETYFKYGDQKVMEKIDVLTGRLEKQIELMDRRIRKQEAISNREMTEAELFQIERDIEEDFEDNHERFEQIQEAIEADRLNRQRLELAILEEDSPYIRKRKKSL